MTNHDLPFRDALSADPEGFMAVIDIARQIWEPDEMVRWLETPQRRWLDQSPIQLIASDQADDVIDVLERMPLP